MIEDETSLNNDERDDELKISKRLNYGIMKKNGSVTPFIETKNFENYGDSTFHLRYGTGEVEGNIAKDKVCINGEFCFGTMYFLAVNRANEIEEDYFSGILGLAPGSNPSI